MHRGDIHLHSHSHGSQPGKSASTDDGVDFLSDESPAGLVTCLLTATKEPRGFAVMDFRSPIPGWLPQGSYPSRPIGSASRTDNPDSRTEAARRGTRMAISPPSGVSKSIVTVSPPSISRTPTRLDTDMTFGRLSLFNRCPIYRHPRPTPVRFRPWSVASETRTNSKALHLEAPVHRIIATAL